MLTLASFNLRFPEFAGVDSGQIQQFINDAANEMSVCVWGNKYEQAQGYLVAHTLAMTPFGQAARLVTKGTTTYEAVYRRLQREVTSGFRTT